MFDKLAAPEPDALYRVVERFRTDTRPHKMDLGVGVYRAGDGTSPIMQAVAIASKHLLEEERTKAYSPLRGVDAFLDSMKGLLVDVRDFERIACIQSVGGTGGLRLALELARNARPDLTVHIGVPTWPNHIGMCQSLGLKTNCFEYFDPSSQTVSRHHFEEAIDSGEAGDVVVFHGPCHNPSGADLTDDEYFGLINKAASRGMIPLIDAAYYGLGNSLREDLSRLGQVVNALPSGMLVMSCSKAFSLYSERVGVLFGVSPSARHRAPLQSALETVARRLYSVPPSYGASIVARILSNEALTRTWMNELEQMRQRIVSVRSDLAEFSNGMDALSSVNDQKGIFSLLPISKSHTERLGRDFGIHMPASGRINVAGFKDGDPERFCQALGAVL